MMRSTGSRGCPELVHCSLASRIGAKEIGYHMLKTGGALWGVAGVLLLLGSAVYRLSFPALDAFSCDFIWYHWVSFALIAAFMAYAEGFRAFQQGFSPRVAARARYLRDNPRVSPVILAPLFCMGFFYATRRRQVTSIAVTAGIILLVILVRLLPQPWRGIIDAGVIIGLAWGVVSLFIFSFKAFSSDEFSYSPEVPVHERAI